ncbi:MAG: hypothetical protein JXQ71_00955 [Verrucomicrobia bacterium]|nr:hypothetical protein [Verrucomicrobiota bacterium]
MSHNAKSRSLEFLNVADQFKLGVLVTESPHPVTANLSDVAREDIAAGLRQLFEVDDDVIRKYGEFARSGRAAGMAQTVLQALEGGGKIFFTGCGSTGRLSIQLVSIWRDFWQRQQARGLRCDPGPGEWEQRAWSVMAGGDFALIKAVEGFEDFTAFGKKQIADLGVAKGDVVFAITEGGETSFVIGTAWRGVEVGARVFFVYNNPDDILCDHVQRSREVILDPRIEKINLTTGPMAITGSTRMQATSIQLAVVLTVLEMVLRGLMARLEPAGPCALDPAAVPGAFLRQLTWMHAALKEVAGGGPLARLVAMEESVYRAGRRNNYFASRFGIDVLTDTTERSPTFCTPPFRKWDDPAAAESWAFLYVPSADTPGAWQHILKRHPQCVDWSEDDVRALVGEEKLSQTIQVVRKIGAAELMRFKIGRDGLEHRPPMPGGSAVVILDESECGEGLAPGGFYREQLEAARRAGAHTAILCVARQAPPEAARPFSTRVATPEITKPAPDFHSRVADELARVGDWDPQCIPVLVPVPETDFLLDGVARVGLKLVLNALSTCTMVRLGRVMGNYMIWVMASNLKLIDRATRYIQHLTGLDYPAANELLFESVEYVEPRWKADKAYPPVVGLSVMRQRHGLSHEQAEARLMAELASPHPA